MTSKLRMIALYDCTADDAEELSFKEGDIFVDVTQSNDKDWYEGRIENTNKRGLFPGNFVKTLPNLFGDTINQEDAFNTVLGGFLKTEPKVNLKDIKSQPAIQKPMYKQKIETKMKFSTPVVKEDSPTRTRSYSASFVKNAPDNNLDRILRPSQLTSGGKSELEIALSKGSPKTALRPSLSSKYGTNLIELDKTNLAQEEEEEEEEDGFQLIKPSQIRLQKLQPSYNNNKGTNESWKRPQNQPKIENLPAPSNPMPRLPSRPVSAASRKSRNNRSSTSLPENIPKPSSLKPKPQSQPTLPPRPKKLRSVSNPPPLQPKPTFSSHAIKNTAPPRVGVKPVSYQIAAKVISPPMSPPAIKENIKQDENLKPSALLNRARSATNPPYFGPKPAMDLINNSAKKTLSAGLPTRTEETKRKVAPPPPPSRPPKDGKFIDHGAKARYETLFDMIHDEGYVDGETVHAIWTKSKLPRDELFQLWKECDPDHKGLLDKNAFIHGMGKIDVILKKASIGIVSK